MPDEKTQPEENDNGKGVSILEFSIQNYARKGKDKIEFAIHTWIQDDKPTDFILINMKNLVSGTVGQTEPKFLGFWTDYSNLIHLKNQLETAINYLDEKIYKNKKEKIIL